MSAGFSHEQRSVWSRPRLVLATFVMVAGCTVGLDLPELQRGCEPGQKECGGQCVDIDDPAFGCAPDGCEPCSVPNGAARCDATLGCVAATCEPRFKLCAGECVSVLNPLVGCNRVGCDPCVLPDATATCSPLGECIVAACSERRGDCNRTPADGCERNFNEDVAHCGACDRPCTPLPNATVMCGGANCVVATCNQNWGNCDGNERNGCETDLRASALHCGKCRATCPSGQTCINGACE